MSKILLPISPFESSVIWRFLDGVSTAVSSRMTHGSSPDEPNLTFLLCELLDENTTSLHALGYSLSQLKSDLEGSDAGLTLDVTFETHEHSNYLEGRFSGADLGIVISVDHPVLGQSRRGMLIQAKRLFPSPNKREYRLNSNYNSFDNRQAHFLKLLQEKFGVYNSVYYLWYNPPSTAFQDDDAKILRAYEASGPGSHRHWQRIHEFFHKLISIMSESSNTMIPWRPLCTVFDELIEMGIAPWFFGSGSPRIGPSEDNEDKARQWRRTQPALRLSSLGVVLEIADTARPRLKALYEATRDPQSSPAFSPFGDFVLLAIASSRYGSENEDWIRLAEGQKVSMPPRKVPTPPMADLEDLDELDSPPVPRHTLRVSISSTLPLVG